MKSGAARYRAKHLRKGRARTAGGRRAAPTSPENRAVIRLVICGVIFVALVAVKLLFPEAVSRLADTAGALIGRDADFQEGNRGRVDDATERRFERGEGNVAEDDLVEAGPEAAAAAPAA